VHSCSGSGSEFATMEAHDAFSKLRNASERLQESTCKAAEDFGIPVSVTTIYLMLHFTDLIKYNGGRLRGPQWRLVNLLNRGHVTLAKNEMIQFWRGP